MRAPPCWPPRPGTGPSRTPRSPTATRSTSAGSGCGRWPRRDTPPSTFATCCWTAAARWRVLRRVVDRRLSRPHRPLLGAGHRGAGPGPVPLAAPSWPCCPALDAGVAHARGRVVLLRPARRRPYHHHRGGEGGQPAAGRTGRGLVHPPAAGQPGLPTRLLPPRLAEVNRHGPAPVTSAPGLAPLHPGRRPRPDGPWAAWLIDGAARHRLRRRAHSPARCPSAALAVRHLAGLAGAGPRFRWPCARRRPGPGEVAWQALEIGCQEPWPGSSTAG